MERQVVIQKTCVALFTSALSEEDHPIPNQHLEEYMLSAL